VNIQHTEKHTQCETHTLRERQKHTERHTHRHTETCNLRWTHKLRDTHTERHTQRHTETFKLKGHTLWEATPKSGGSRSFWCSRFGWGNPAGSRGGWTCITASSRHNSPLIRQLKLDRLRAKDIEFRVFDKLAFKTSLSIYLWIGKYRRYI